MSPLNPVSPRSRHTRHLADLLADLQRNDPGRPRITWYVVDDGPSDGERVELSGAVLANWASKAAGLLQDELDCGPGSVVLLDLPPHWRSLYWAIAAWTVGATVTTHDATGPAGSGTTDVADVVVTADPASAPEGDAVVVVTLAALARQAVVEVPAGAVDEARELATYPDAVVAYARAGDGDVALAEPPLTFMPGTGYGEAPVLPAPDQPLRRLDEVRADSALGPWLEAAARTLCAGGSLVAARIAQGTPDGAARRVQAIAEQEKIGGGARSN